MTSRRSGSGTSFPENRVLTELLARNGDHRIAVAGDWHANTSSSAAEMRSICTIAPDVRLLFQLGDFGLRPGPEGAGSLTRISDTCEHLDIDVIVTPGHDEHWGILTAAFNETPGEPVELVPRVWFLPRGYRFRLGGLVVLSFSGGASSDPELQRLAGRWWPQEAATSDEVARAIADGPIDVLLTHEPITGGVRRVDHMFRLAIRQRRRSNSALAYAIASRWRLTKLWNETHAQILFHGHAHERGSRTLSDGRRVYSLGKEGRRGNTGLFDPATGRFDWNEQLASATTSKVQASS